MNKQIIRRQFNVQAINEYINHAVQTEKRREEINNIIDYGVNDTKIAKYFIQKEGEWYFKRNVLLLLGAK